MPYIDSHCHLHLAPLGQDVIGALQRAADHHVSHMLCVSVTLEDIQAIQVLMREHTGIFGSVGVHPNEAPCSTTLFDDLTRLARLDGVVAIGETGLDYYRLEEGEAPATQQQSFRQHIAAARHTQKPLIIHTREAAADTLRILSEEGAAEVGGVLHCFTESEAVARAALDLNFYISFSGIVTFKNAEALRAVARFVPEDRLLIETDAPYLAPVPHRGKSNEPSFVRHVAQCLADIRQVPLERIADSTSRNFFSLFKDAA